ncbi:MAG: biosynthetic arginine decarboxylase [Gammaproteobacteria bacterium]
MNWSIDNARELYNLSRWSEGYFDVAEDGWLQLRPLASAQGSVVSFKQLIEKLRDESVKWPVLVRCHTLLRHRIGCLQEAFAKAQQEHGYTGSYLPVYPIKVNQQSSVIAEIISQQECQVGLEAGSKSELLAVLGVSPAAATIICNGYKDSEYIRFGLIGRRLGYRLFLVVDKFSEIHTIIEHSQRMGIRPLLGVRVRMASIGLGNWQNTGGEKSKFGLSSTQVLAMIERLREAGMLDCLQLLHFHPGSQLSDIKHIRAGITEAARFYVELLSSGVPLQVIDVGGGLGVDYEGRGSNSFCSVNYTMEAYADCIVSVVNNICRQANVAAPELMTECGRAMVAHHAFLLTNIVDVERGCAQIDEAAEEQPLTSISSQLQALKQSGDTPESRYRQASELMRAMLELYRQGSLGLAQRAQIEQLFTALCCQLQQQAQPVSGQDIAFKEILDEKLADKYFMNLSVFQSLPDVWAIDQIFPVVPVNRLDEEPSSRAILQDLTCDSDGHIEHYAMHQGLHKTLAVHAVQPGEDYILAIFLVGAYQEILGDIHNLFGDTDVVNIEIETDGSVMVCSAEKGDRTDELLTRVHFELDALSQQYQQRIQQADLSADAAKQYLAELEAGLSGYTYFTVADE